MVYKNRIPPPPLRFLRFSTPSYYRGSSSFTTRSRKLWLSTVGGCAVLVNSTYNLSYLSPFCSSYLPSPPSRPNPLSSSFSYPLTHVVLFYFRLIHTQSHSHALAYFTFLCRLFSSSFFLFVSFFFCLE